MDVFVHLLQQKPAPYHQQLFITKQSHSRESDLPNYFWLKIFTWEGAYQSKAVWWKKKKTLVAFHREWNAVAASCLLRCHQWNQWAHWVITARWFGRWPDAEVPQCNHQKTINILNRGIIPLVQRPQGEISALITPLKTAAVISVCVCSYVSMHVCMLECACMHVYWITVQYINSFGNGGLLHVFLFVNFFQKSYKRNELHESINYH